MASIRYINQSAPFWDFVANLENQGANHPFFQQAQQATGERSQEAPTQENPWAWGPWGRRGHHGPHRGGPHHGPHHRGHRGPPPPEQQQQHEGETETEGEDVPPPPFEEKEGSPATLTGEPSNTQTKDSEPEKGKHCGGPGRRGHCGGRRGSPGFRGFGGHGPPWAARGGFPFGGPFGDLAGAFFGENKGEAGEENFKPDADVFDTEEAFVVHVSLPGAKKEDVGVSWDAEKSELTIAGVLYRPADEELLKHLALDERKAGAFERKVRLGSRANPANVDVDSIAAKLEEGILQVVVPKTDKDYVEIKKVDIE